VAKGTIRLEVPAPPDPPAAVIVAVQEVPEQAAVKSEVFAGVVLSPPDAAPR